MTSTSSLRRCGGVFALAAALFWPGADIAAETPQARLQGVADGLLQEIRLRSDEFREDNRALQDFVKDSMQDILDYEWIQMIILGKKRFSETRPEQREAFTTELIRQLVRLYAETILTYSHGKLRYLPFEHQADKPYQVVRTEFLISGKEPVDLIYLMREVDGDWRVFEIRAAGIFLIKSLKDSWRPEIEQNGLDALIERLRSNRASESTSRRFAPHAPA